MVRQPFDLCCCCSDQLQAALAESSLLQDEYDKLSLRHNKLQQDTGNKEDVWRQRLEQLTAENTSIAAERTTMAAQLSHQSDMLTQTFKEQVSELLYLHMAL